MAKASGLYEAEGNRFNLCTSHAATMCAIRIDDCAPDATCDKCDDDTLQCPECGSTEIEGVLFVVPTLHFSAGKEPTVSDFMFRSGEDEFYCVDCGHEWFE